jgi:hypothetical protein
VPSVRYDTHVSSSGPSRREEKRREEPRRAKKRRDESSESSSESSDEYTSHPRHPIGSIDRRKYERSESSSESSDEHTPEPRYAERRRDERRDKGPPLPSARGYDHGAYVQSSSHSTRREEKRDARPPPPPERHYYRDEYAPSSSHTTRAPRHQRPAPRPAAPDPPNKHREAPQKPMIMNGPPRRDGTPHICGPRGRMWWAGDWEVFCRKGELQVDIENKRKNKYYLVAIKALVKHPKVMAPERNDILDLQDNYKVTWVPVGDGTYCPTNREPFWDCCRNL